MYVIISGYKFNELSDLPNLQAKFIAICQQQAIKGTILISAEGINVNLVGRAEAIDAFTAALRENQALSDINFHRTFTETMPFKRLKVKIKKEIITFKEQLVLRERAKAVTAPELKKWLDEKKDFTLLDTRNDYEISFGTFTNAINLKLNHFTDLPQKINELDRTKPIVMFCTGGIRCEKAAVYLAAQGFAEVYQLDKGILGYFAEVGQTHFEGNCFVFDERVAVTPSDYHLHQE